MAKKKTTTKKKPRKKLSTFDVQAYQSHFSVDPIHRLSKDLKAAAKLMGRAEARYLVDLYYQAQKTRQLFDSRVDACQSIDEPVDLLRWSAANYRRMEIDIKAALGVFAGEYAVGQWLQSIHGIGRVISAGLLTEFTIWPRLEAPCPTCKDSIQDKVHGPGIRGFRLSEPRRDDGTMRFLCSGMKKKKVPCREEMIIHPDHLDPSMKLVIPYTAGHYWRFSGLDPNQVWKKKSLRPWNARAKVLAWKAAESLVKQGNSEKSFYGPLFRDRKAREIERNRSGELAETARKEARKAEEKARKEKKNAPTTGAYLWHTACYPAEIWDGYLALDQEAREAREKRMLGEPGSGVPMLHPGWIHNRALRWLMKLLLSHLHHVSYLDYYGSPPPVPYAFSDHCHERHGHYIAPPTAETNGLPLRDLLTTRTVLPPEIAGQLDGE
jgi:hypothetical protein